MVINIGSLFGRGTAFVVRSGSGLVTILEVVAICGQYARTGNGSSEMVVIRPS